MHSTYLYKHTCNLFKQTAIMYVLEIRSYTHVYFPTVRLHFSTRKRKRACLNNGSRLVLNYILYDHCILF